MANTVGLKGLRGLRSLGELSDGERNKFYADNAAILSKYSDNPMHYGIAAERLYNNHKFIQKFGKEAFDQLNDGTKASYDLRNQLFHDKVIFDAYQDTWGHIDTPEGVKKHPFTAQVASQLDIQGMYDLLTNEEYLGPLKRKMLYEKDLKAAKKVEKDFNRGINNPYVDALSAGFATVGKEEAALTPSKNYKDREQKDKEILEKLYAETQKRREEGIQDAADLKYAEMLDADASGKKSLARELKEFDQLAMNGGEGFYATFKNSSWLKGYTNEDKLKDYAKYKALKERYGEGMAQTYLMRSMQDKVAEAQDGKWTGNTLKGLLTTAWSDFGANVSTLAHLGAGVDRLAVLNQGKDPDKPIYDKRGNIIDYKEDENWFTNPAYWNNVYKYNTFSPTEIKAIQERGGVSEDINVRPYGYTPDFFSWDTFEEGFKQGGHVLEGVAETALLGGIGKAVGWTGKGLLGAMNASQKVMRGAAKAGKITNDLFVAASTGIAGAQLEAMGTFDDQLQTAKEKIQNQIVSELRDYQKSINYDSEESKGAINAYYNQLKRQDNRRMALSSREGTRAFPISDKTLLAQAKQLYTNSLLKAKQAELEQLHKKDELEAAKVAAKAYTTNFIMDYIKEVPLTTAIQKFKIAKGSMRGAFDNTVSKNVIADAETGGVKRITNKAGVEKRYTSAKNLSKALGKQVLGGFADEYLDGLNASFSSAIGDNMFDNYIKKNYDPKSYMSATETLMGNFLAGVSGGVEGITDRQNLYEGFIGAISPVASTVVNPNTMYHPKDAWKAVVNGRDPYGNKVNITERLGSILMNPLLNVYTEAKEKDRNIDRTVNAINAVVERNKKKIGDASKLLSVLDSYNGTIHTENNPYSLLDSKDDKLYNSFTLINTLNTLENIDGGKKSELYESTMRTLEGLANGTLSEKELNDEIDRFLADEDNKSVLDEASSSEGEENNKGREVAAQRLQANAKYLIDMRDKLNEVEEKFNQSPNMANISPSVKEALAYNIVASDDYKKRLQTIEEELNINKTDADALYTPDFEKRYGSVTAKRNAIAARERQVNALQKKIEETNKSERILDLQIKTWESELKDEWKKDKKEEIQENLNKANSWREANKFERTALKERKSILESEIEDINKIEVDGRNVFTEEDILNMDARDRAAVLDPANRKNFSKRQQTVIEHTLRNLKQKDPDAETKIKDASTLANRINDMKNVYGKIMDNSDIAMDYLDAVEYNRETSAMEESLQRELKDRYAKIEEAYKDKDNDPKRWKDALLNNSSRVLEAYMNDHPEQAVDVQSYYDMLKFDEDAVAVINGDKNISDEDKMAMKRTLIEFQERANNRQELTSIIEGLVDSDTVEKAHRDLFDGLLDKMERLGYQRDATTIKDRRKREEEKVKTSGVETPEHKERETEEKEEEKKGERKDGGKQEEKQEERKTEGRIEERKEEAGKQDEQAKQEGSRVEAPVEAVREESYKHKASIDGKDYVYSVEGDDDILKDYKTEKAGSNNVETLLYEEGEDKKEEAAEHREGENKKEGEDNKKEGSNDGNNESNESNENRGNEGNNINNGNSESYNGGTAQRINDLLRDDVLEGVVDAGEIWYGTEMNPKKVRMTVEKEENEIFFKAGGNRIYLSLQPEEYVIPNGDEHKGKDYSYSAFSLADIDNNWTFLGSFADEETETRLPMKKDFNLEKAVEREIAESEAWALSLGKDVESPSLTVTEQGIEGKIPTIEEQAKELEKEGKSVEVIDLDSTEKDTTGSEKNTDESKEATGGNKADDTGKETTEGNKNDTPVEEGKRASNTLTGTGMKWYDISLLVKDGVLRRVKPREKDDNLTKYHAWMDAEGIKIQNIADRELCQILEENPHAKVKFMCTPVNDNATHDVDIKTHLLLVLDYDDKINKGITSIHDDSNGGVLESQGKKYLIIGVAGWITSAQKALYDHLWFKYGEGRLNIKLARKKFFEEHPEERFFVDERYSTEIKPYSLLPGYRIRQLEDESHPDKRSVVELIEDKKRNPLGIRLEDVIWGIQEADKFVVVNGKGLSANKIMVPRDDMGNRGRAFVFVPASNGKYFPGYFEPLMYNEMKDGELKRETEALLNAVASPDYETAVNAIKGLFNIFYVSKEGDNILRNEKYHTLTLIHDGEPFKTFTVDNNFDRAEFMKAVAQMNPRINITARVLGDPSLIRKYAEAGAMQTDLALFHTAGTSFSIYGLDSDGEMIIPENPSNSNGGREFERTVRQLVYNHKYYREVDGEYSINGELVKDEDVLRQLRQIRRILDNGLAPVKRVGIKDYYILSNGEHPEAVRVDSNSKEVEELSKEDAKKLIAETTKKEVDNKRKEAAEMEIKKQEKLEDVNLNLEGGKLNDNGTDLSDLTVNPETGLAEMPSQPVEHATQPVEKTEEKSQPTAEEKKAEKKEEEEQYILHIFDSFVERAKTQNFKELYMSRKYKMQIAKIIRKKWKEAPKKIEELTEFLRSKNIMVEGIGTSEEDVQAWMKTLEECR